jgi:type 1 fimbria pilin
MTKQKPGMRPNRASYVLLLAGLLAVILPMQVVAVPISIEGTLIVPPTCSINHDVAIEVNFGDRINIKKIDGIEYQKQNLNYSLDCQGGTPNSNWLVQLKVDGGPANFDRKLLTTTMPGLGIKFLANGSDLAINTISYITAGSKPTLEAVLMKDPRNSPTAGPFFATANLSIMYY